MKAWSSWESFHGKNYFQVLTQEEKLTHDTAILVAKRNSMVAKAAESMARAVVENEAMTKEIVAINEQIENKLAKKMTDWVQTRKQFLIGLMKHYCQEYNIVGWTLSFSNIHEDFGINNAGPFVIKIITNLC
jgi:hypothetical protein